ncbi:hypothetical protein SH1V18_26660 [Vallitalea longa]|uniref:Uncharacterized protein n=1 Tax=Vallitalea longa TaxID=2936439 RepID=A0A9W5YCK4_9FIRM|nr:hypothetical protein [Vallitalea longa]GKX30186.1 hypothetical protein SH1V18_26660 [Vallitalea longa]
MKSKKYKKVLIVGCIVIVISLISNIIYFKAQQLDKPIVLEHYIEKGIGKDQDIYLDFYYVTNRSDTSQLIEVYFPKQDLQSYVDYVNTYSTKYYKVNQLRLQILYSDLQNLDENEIILENAVLNYNNGLKQNVDMGEIILTRTKNNSLKSTSSGSSSSGESWEYYKLDKTITINKITSAFYNGTKDFVYMNFIDNYNISSTEIPIEEDEKLIQIGNKTYYPMKELKLPHKATKHIEVISYIRPDDERRFNIYEMRYTLEFTNKDGEEGSENLLNMRYIPCFTEKFINDLGQYLKDDR